MYPDYKALHFYARFLRGYVTRLARDEAERPVIDLDMLCPPGLSGAPVMAKMTELASGAITATEMLALAGRTNWL